jgi:hypothetical protein
MTRSNMAPGGPKKRIGIAMPAKSTAPKTNASFTTLDQAVPRSPAVKTKSASTMKATQVECATSDVCGIAPGALIGT